MNTSEGRQSVEHIVLLFAAATLTVTARMDDRQPARCAVYAPVPRVNRVIRCIASSTPQTNNKDGQPIAHSANVNKACHATQAAKSRDLWQEMCHVVRYDSK